VAGDRLPTQRGQRLKGDDLRPIQPEAVPFQASLQLQLTDLPSSQAAGGEVNPGGGQAWRSERSECSQGLPGAGPEGGMAGVLSHLVSYRHNSAKQVPTEFRWPGDGGAWEESTSPDKSIDSSVFGESSCPGAFWLVGECDHGNKRARLVFCDRRDCDFCGRVRRRRIAERITYGIREIAGGLHASKVRKSGEVREICLPAGRCAFLVGTFPEKAAADGTDKAAAKFKKKAVRRLGSFVRACRKETGVNLQYAVNWELGEKYTRRLHVNIVIGPWVFIPHEKLELWWGGRISVEWVKDEAEMGVEAAKSYSVEGLARYLSKRDQAVPERWKRHVGFSEWWPRVPREGLPRQGEIVWSYDREKWLRFFRDDYYGRLIEAGPGEVRNRDEDCDCFHVVAPSSRDGP